MSGADFSHEVRKHKSLAVRWLFALLGAVFTVLGVVGIFLPVLPTTPFLLLAAACFARASSRIYHWLLRHSILGPIILEWRQHRAMPYRAKRTALILIALSFSTSILFFVPYWQAQLAMGLAGVVLFAWVYRIPSRDHCAPCPGKPSEPPPGGAKPSLGRPDERLEKPGVGENQG